MMKELIHKGKAKKLLVLVVIALLLSATSAVAAAPIPMVLAAGDGHSMVVYSDGTLWAFGANTSGQLGDGTQKARSAMARVMTGVADVACGTEHTLALDKKGNVWAFGSKVNPSKKAYFQATLIFAAIGIVLSIAMWGTVAALIASVFDFF